MEVSRRAHPSKRTALVVPVRTVASTPATRRVVDSEAKRGGGADVMVPGTPRCRASAKISAAMLPHERSTFTRSMAPMTTWPALVRRISVMGPMPKIFCDR
ncbi:MAG: hypothetical protein QM820_53635 [Minicystis sp.]